MSLLKCVIYLQLVIISIKSEEGFLFSQDLYNVWLEKIDIVYQDKNIFKDVNIKFFDYKSQYALNSSVYILKELGTDLHGTMDFFKMTSNTFRAVPPRLAGNCCKHYNANSFNCQDFLRNGSNFAGCPTKSGLYYVNTGVIGFSILPPVMVEGYFKAVLKGYEKDLCIGEEHVYAHIELKRKRGRK